jgi:hypothetical protein
VIFKLLTSRAAELAREASPLALRATNVKTFPKTFLSFLIDPVAGQQAEARRLDG